MDNEINNTNNDINPSGNVNNLMRRESLGGMVSSLIAHLYKLIVE